jgi:hypothetical protein
MKINIKLNKDESEAFKNWSTMVMPEGMDMDGFCRAVFFKGIETLQNNLREMALNTLKNEETRKQMQDAGVNVEELEKSLGLSGEKTDAQPKTE